MKVDQDSAIAAGVCSLYAVNQKFVASADPVQIQMFSFEATSNPSAIRVQKPLLLVYHVWNETNSIFMIAYN